MTPLHHNIIHASICQSTSKSKWGSSNAQITFQQINASSISSKYTCKCQIYFMFKTSVKCFFYQALITLTQQRDFNPFTLFLQTQQPTNQCNAARQIHRKKRREIKMRIAELQVQFARLNYQRPCKARYIHKAHQQATSSMLKQTICSIFM